MKRVSVCWLSAAVFCLQALPALAVQTNWVYTVNFQLTAYAQSSVSVSGTRVTEKMDTFRLDNKSLLALLNQTTNLDTNGVLVTNYFNAQTLLLKQEVNSTNPPVFVARYKHGSVLVDTPLDGFMPISISDGVRSGTKDLTTGLASYKGRRIGSLTYTNQQGTDFVLSGMAQSVDKTCIDKTVGNLGVLTKSMTIDLSGYGTVERETAVLSGKLALSSPKVEVR